MLTYDLPLRHALSPVKRVGGRRYEAHIFQRAVFPLAAGRYALPPAQLVYSLAYTPSFFSREETHELRTDSTVIYALEPPEEGRPADYTGAVGELVVAARLDTGVGRVGDPMKLTTRVTGAGNVKLFPRPKVEVPWATVVPSEERVYVDSSSLLVRGNKEFDWVLTPRVAGSVTLPPVSYPYFDPQKRRYEIALSAPETLSILPGTLTLLDSARTDTTPVLAIRTEYRGEVPPPPLEHPLFWLMLAVVPIPAAVLGIASRWRPLRRVGGASRQLRSLSGRPTAERVATIRRVFVNALGERLLVSPEELSRRGALARALRRAGATRDTAAASEQLLRELDVAAYSGHAAPPLHAAKRAYELFRRIDNEAIERDGLPGKLLPILLACFVSGASLYALAGPSAAEASFHRGVDAYRARQFNEAQAHFAAAAEQEPRAPDAWANYGTAGWAANRNAEATVGWQRAARLEPLAIDVRDRLAALRGWQRGNLEWVPPLPPAPLAFAGALLWLAGWVVLSFRATGRAPQLKWWGPSVTIAGAVFVLAAAQADRLLAARDLAVIMQPGPLRALPALGADRLAALEAGHVVRTIELRSQWALIQYSTDREGWIERDRLTSIARDN
jgi:tetratricopeptide (TPR) repeat protein